MVNMVVLSTCLGQGSDDDTLVCTYVYSMYQKWGKSEYVVGIKGRFRFRIVYSNVGAIGIVVVIVY